MIRKSIDLGWRFYRGLPNHGFKLENAVVVDLPHDFNVEEAPVPTAPAHAATGYYAGSAATYVKELDIGPEYEGRTVMLEFDGVYMNAVVSMNGQAVCRHNYGYTPFVVDITDYIRPGKTNRLQVFVDNTPQPNSRWYSGAGIYRHVDLLVSDDVRIAPWGIYAHTDHIVNGDVFVMVETTVANDTAKDVKVQLVSSIEDEEGNTVGSNPGLVYVPAMSTANARVMVRIPEAKLWDIDSPYLYIVKTEIKCGEKTDSWQDWFGVRTISVDTVNGFMLNGRTVKLKGGCIHHDNGLLGAESYYDSEYRKLKIQKDGGFNAMRTAHNPPSRDMLLAADRLGILVLDEAFDCWFNSKSVNDYGRYFEADWEKDIEAFMLRDRNHPCVFMWSTGNEIVERGGMSKGYALAAKLADKMRSVDPTRPVLNALCSLWSGLEDDVMAKMQEELRKVGAGYIENSNTPYIDNIWAEYTEYFCAPLDVVGYNYIDKRYAMDGERYPGRVICGTESFGNDFDNVWAHTMAHPYVIGDFTWTSYDYIGEAGIGKSTFHDPNGDIPEAPSHISAYPWRLGNDADYDICGNEKAQLWFRRVVWGEKDTYIGVQDPVHFGKVESISRWGFEDVTDSWTWPGYENRRIKVTVYSNADMVQLMVNGASAGRKKPERFRAVFELNYEPGVIEAVSYNNDLDEISRCRIETAGTPAKLAIIPERTTAPADGHSLIFANIEVQDAEGRRVPGVSDVISVEIDGPATLAAFGGADPITEENYSLNIGKTFRGRAQAILRMKTESGKITLSAKMGDITAETELFSE